MARISVTVSPGAARTELAGRHGEGWRARVAAPPERGRANQELIGLLADVLDVPRSSVRVVGGASARTKVVEVDGLDPVEVERPTGPEGTLLAVARLVPVLVLVLLLAGCGGGDNSSEGSGTTTPTAECEPLSGGTLEQKLSPALERRDPVFLTDVEIEIDDCVERVTFKFKESEPGPPYDVSYKPADVAKIEDGSGNPLAIAGADFLVVRMSPAMTAEIDGEDVKPTYEGPRSIPAPMEARFIREVAQTGDFEAQVTWAIGLDNEHPFTATATSDELVIEIGS